MPTIEVPATATRPRGNRINSIGYFPYNGKTGSDNGIPVSGPQVVTDPLNGVLSHDAGIRWNPFERRFVDFRKMRAMRKDPTIALARDIAAAPILAASTSIEVDEEGSEWLHDYAEDYVQPLRDSFVRSALYGEMDFGWRAYEKTFTHETNKLLGDVIYINRVKALVNDNTWARFDKYGDFDGLLHRSVQPFTSSTSGWVIIDREHSIFVNNDDDGTGTYNDPQLLNVEEAYDNWLTAADAARRYDEKIAGAVWVISYPEGKTKYKGEETDNYDIALDIARQLRASGTIIVPNTLDLLGKDEVDLLGQPGWGIKLIEASGSQSEFIARFDYLDKLKIRGCGILERAMVEGNYGTKAEAESHINVMLLLMELKHKYLTDVINKEILDPGISLNRPNEVGMVRLVSQPLTDEKRAAMLDLFKVIMTDDAARADIIDEIDAEEILRTLNIPVMSAQAKEEKDNDERTRIRNMLMQAGALMNGEGGDSQLPIDNNAPAQNNGGVTQVAMSGKPLPAAKQVSAGTQSIGAVRGKCPPGCHAVQ